MWKDPQGKLEEHIRVSNTIQIRSFIVGEWNHNDFEKINNYGTYRYRPSSSASSQYFNVPLNYDVLDLGAYYTSAEDSKYTFSDFVNDDDEPVLFETTDTDRSLYFSLKECFNLFRPRSGINKAIYLNNKYIDNVRSAKRPRYYLSSRYDNFKYWNSFRRQIEDNNVVERGISSSVVQPGFNESVGYFIDDTAPFVIYEDAVPTNRIVVKMQTNLAELSLGTIRLPDGTSSTDPLADRTKSSIPKRFRIDYLDQNNNWVNAASFNENSLRRDGSDIVKWDGYIELYYGPKIPDEFRESFNFVDYLDNINNLPDINVMHGEAYIVGASESSQGTLYIWNSVASAWISQVPNYGFSLSEDDDTQKIGVAKYLVDPPFFANAGETIFREIAFVKGLRLVVETMIAPDTPFELIELSPRLKVDLSNHVQSFDFIKSISNDSTGLPVGGLLASNGMISIFNNDGAFSESNYNTASDNGLFTGNTGSIIAKYLKPNIKFDIYEAILNVDGFDKYIPIKSMYAENFPPASGGMSIISVPIRDQFFKIEMTRCPSIFLTNTTLTSAVSILLDNIGFSNYIFKGFSDITGSFDEDREYLATKLSNGLITRDEYNIELDKINSQLEYFSSINDPVIPYFFVKPDISVAQALVSLAMSTQTAIFFDEYNNLVIMPKEYLLPDSGKRATSVKLLGQIDSDNSLPNIIDINNSETQILNDGVITYSIKYIQKAYTSLSQSFYVDEDQTYSYKPVLLWEVANNAPFKTQNNENQNSSGYTLAAAPLNTTLTASVPYVVNHQIDPQTNIIDLGENVYWLGRFQGYLYANGEIIRYDAIQYDISGSGRVWITSNQQYQKYFASLPFNGKIFPTGNVRIFAEPYYVTYEGAPATESLDENVTYKNGDVKRHGRGQFGTSITEHQAGLSEYWSNDINVRGCKMESTYLFSTTPTDKITYPTTSALGASVGTNTPLAQKSTRNGIIKNYFRRNIPSDDIVKKLKATSSGTIQSSALVFSGPQEFPSDINKRDFISYIYKPLDAAYKHFGTRMRIIGKLETNGKIQSPTNSSPYFNVQPNSTAGTVNINGGSGGIGVGVSPDKNYGYFFEICALTEDNLSQYFVTNKETGQLDTVLHNIIFYKVVPSDTLAIPRKLWGGLSQIIVDEGRFTGQDRIGSQQYPTVYDLSVEYENIGSTRRFYLYINGSQIAYVDDANPLPEYTNMAVFTRGSSEIMFEHIYAIQSLISKNTGETVVNEISDAFGLDEITNTAALRKYSLPGFVNSTFLTGISAQNSSKYKIYFEEFGTIMRECAYFNIRYDQAYPALLAQIAPTFNQERGYSISGFYAGSYGAEFLIFNTTDKTIVLDETTGNYLRILGVTFTQNSTEELNVDDYFKERSRLSDPMVIDGVIKSPIVADKFYQDVKTSRNKYGKREFNLDAQYIQSYDDARELMDWIINKTLRPRKRVEIQAFGIPHLQVGDIVTINYDMPEGVKFVDPSIQFVVSEISYSKGNSGISSILKVVEV